MPAGPRLPRPSMPSPRVLRIELLAGLVVALALIPEAISFSIIAGVDPKVGLYASFTMAVAIAFTGGRPAMISAATGAMALVVVSLVRDHGVEYLLAATVLAGIIQVTLGALGAAKLMRFVPRSVMTGFVNALAILILLAQLPQLTGGNPAVFVLVAAGLAVIVGLPRLTKAVPAPLIAIVALTIFTVAAGVAVPTVGDQGELPSVLPWLGIPSVPLSFATLSIIAPVRADARGGRPARVAADRAAGRRHHRDRLRQGPRGARPGHRQRHHRLLRRHGGLRDDRPDDDQRARRRAPARGCRRSAPACSC